MNYSDPLWESLDAKYFATTGDFSFSLKSYPSETILMPHFSKTHFLIHSYVVGLLGYLTKIDILPLWNLYGLLFYILGVSSIFYLLWMRFSFFTALISTVVGFFNNAFLPHLYYALGDNAQIGTYAFLMIPVLLFLNKPFIFIAILYIFILLTSFSIGSAVMVFLSLFYSLNLIMSLYNKDIKSREAFLTYIFLVIAIPLIIYFSLYNNLTSSYLKTVITNTKLKLDDANFWNLGFLYIAGSLFGICVFIKKNLADGKCRSQFLLLITSLILLICYFLFLFARNLNIGIDARIWNILCNRYPIYILPLIFFIGCGLHYLFSRIKTSLPWIKSCLAVFALFIAVFVQKANYVYNNIRQSSGNSAAFLYITQNIKNAPVPGCSITPIKQKSGKVYVYEHIADKNFYQTKLGIPYYSTFGIERKIAKMITDNYTNFRRNILVNSCANGAKVALMSGCSVLTEYITPTAWETIFISDNENKTYDILHNPGKYRSEYLSDFEGYFYLPEIANTLPSSKQSYGKVDFVIFYYIKSLNLQNGLNKFLRNPSVYELIEECTINNAYANFNEADKVYIFKVL